MRPRYLLLLSTFFLAHFVFAQYDFGSKSEQKLYEELEGYYNDYDYESILDEEEQILEFFEPKQDTLTALMYSFLSEAYWEFGAVDVAFEYSQKELALRQQVDQENEEGIKNIVFLLGQYADELGMFDEAEQYLTEILESDRKNYGAKSDEYFYSALALAGHYEVTQNYEDAKKGIKLLRGVRRSMDEEHPDYAAVCSSLGALNTNMGSIRQAQKFFGEAIGINDDQGLYASVENARILNQLSFVQQTLGKYPEAEKLQREAISILDRLPGDGDVSKFGFLITMARTNVSLGNFESAETNLNDALDIIRELFGEGSFYETLALSGLGTVNWARGDFDQAETIYLQVLGALENMEAQESFDYINTLHNLSTVYKNNDKTNEALEYAQRSAQGFLDFLGEGHESYVKALYNLGEIHMMRKENVKADEYLQKAKKLADSELGEYHPLYARVTLKLAINQWALENMDEAQELYAQVFANYFKQLEEFFPSLSEEEKTKFYNNKIKPAFEQFNSFLVELSRDEEPLLGLMYDYQLATKGLLLYATNKVRQSIVGSSDTTLLTKYEEWIDQKEQLSKLYSSTEEAVEVRNARIDSLKESANLLEKELGESSTAFAGTYTQGQKTWRDIKATLKPGEAAIEIIRFRNFKPTKNGEYTDEIYYGALIVKHDTEEHPEIVILRNGVEMESRYLANYRNAIKFKMDEDYSYRTYWRPISNRLRGIRKIYFSPDGVYNQISIYTLLNSRSNRFLIDELDIQIVTNTKDLVLASASSNIDAGKAYLFGYPNYNLGVVEEETSQTDIASNVASAASQGRGQRGGERGARGGRGPDGERSFGQLGNGGGLSRGLRGNLQRYISGNNLMALLPGTKVEVESIAKVYGDAEKDPALFIENEATEQEIKTIKDALTLHIATHGFFLESEKLEEAGGELDAYVENPLLRSGLILAGANSFIAAGQISDEYEDGEDGILTAYEAMNLNLDNTELVVLSACETGLGEVSNGEGVYGLQRAFQVAGAKSIIMSMWTVDDAATQELMTGFYDEWIRTGNKQQAFITAQKKLKDKWKSPYYWGAFVMVGQ